MSNFNNDLALASFTHITAFGGTNHGKNFLSCRADGFVDLWQADDGTGRQRWVLKDIGGGLYNIIIYGGTNEGRKYLSCTADGYVDLWSHDAGDCQRWRVSPVGDGTYHIKVAGGTNAGKVFLSCTADGLVDLYTHDDNSGRQKWLLKLPYSHISTSGGTNVLPHSQTSISGGNNVLPHSQTSISGGTDALYDEIYMYPIPPDWIKYVFFHACML